MQTEQKYEQLTQIEIIMNIDHVNFTMDVAAPLGLILNELLTNCFKHAFLNRYQGKVELSLMKTNEFGKFLLQVTDDGVGFPESVNLNNTQSLGLQLVLTLVKQLGGRVNLISNQGAEFKIEFADMQSH